MSQFIQFINANKEWLKPLAYLIISVISTVLVLCVKKKKVLNEMDLILLEVVENLPQWINEAEAFKGAELKKSLVLEAVKKFVQDKFSVNLPDSVLSSISAMVEAILSTPQKH